MDSLTNAFDGVQQWLFETVVQPLAFMSGLGNFLEDAYEGTGWLLVGLVQLVVMLLLIAPLQRWRPVEPVSDRPAIRVDVIYTLIHRLGLFRLVFFFTLLPVLDEVIGWLRVQGMPTFHLDDLWPGVTDQAVVSFLLYLVVMDFFDYWLHRGQHRFEWWWRLHALHHSQRQMTMWSDNRNHLLDDVIRDLLLVTLAQFIGVAPGQFVAIVAITQLSESLHHANVRLWFGRWGERLWVSPRFHRRHHSVGIGHEKPLKLTQASLNAAGPSQSASVPGGSAVHAVTSVGANNLGGCNFGVLLPWWDLLFGTANFEHRYDPTGIRDQVEQGRDYGRGFWAQQWLGLKRLAGKA
ncbi:fatty acid hydroxylase [Hylemonella gracilis str. Niagara R]|uniref:Fatty acid hydroxylase n=1 Tax=Hylemonella gracilis str. Niagara R TaxID=1458275 RepID=A0A016XGW6_9BURK|nr:sterol desaturase family protein [Hylemonella gracilis]EYC51046.1 fatty acid hydroxylase [Hylemonella gracilis str. Niagara R]